MYAQVREMMVGNSIWEMTIGRNHYPEMSIHHYIADQLLNKPAETNKGGIMETDVKVISINGVDYVPQESVSVSAQKLDGMDYVCIRSCSSGCHCGYLKSESEDGRKVELSKARRLWYWSGASSLSQLAMEGVKNSKDCKFPCEVDDIKIMEVCEIIKMTEQARKSIAGVKIWKQ